MKEIHKKIISFFLNDWEDIWCQNASWVVHDSLLGKYDRYCRYAIQQSKYLGKIRLKAYGYKPKSHEMYSHVLEVYRKMKL